MSFNISLAEWSLHRMLNSGQLDHLDFCRVAKKDLGIDAVEYVNQFFFDRAEDTSNANKENNQAGTAASETIAIVSLGNPIVEVDDFMK